MLRPTNRPILAFFDAIKNLRLRQVALILKAGYDPNLIVNARHQNGLQYMVNYYGATDAHFRLQVPINKSAYVAIAKLLLDSGLDPNAADLLTDETVIFDAIRFNDKDMVSLLLNYADLAIRNKNGETPLMCAARFGSKQVMRMLLGHLQHLEMDGYFLRQRNRFGLTALELARTENIECAKVLTKHLITYGHHTNAVLARSTSHHQLLARPLPYHMRAGPYNSRVQAAALLDVDSASDYESDVLAAGVYNPPMGRAARQYGGASGSRGLNSYDTKAAEFNQYLLEQQDLAGSSGDQQQASATGGAISDDEDYLGGGGGGGSGGGGMLTRSRSCMLGPSAGSKQQKYSASKKGGANEPGKMAGASWADSGAGN